jgi:hypothetical protein
MNHLKFQKLYKMIQKKLRESKKVLHLYNITKTQ